MNFIEIVIEFFEFIGLVFLVIYDYIYSFYKVLIPSPLNSLKSEIILVTGAASGIGKEVCRVLVQSGAKTLVLWDLNKIENDKLALELKCMGAKAFSYEVDITDRNKVKETAAKVKTDVGDVTILHNNAGVTHISNMLDQDPDQLEKTIQVNLISHFWTIREFLPSMIEKNHGHIVTTCSTLGFKGVMKGVAYSASKFGARGFIEALKSEIRHHPQKPDIKFTTIHPFFVNTPLLCGLRIQYRLSFLFPHFTPQYVAEKIVKGIQKNIESIHIPWYIPHLLFLENFGPRTACERVIDFFVKEIKCEDVKDALKPKSNSQISPDEVRLTEKIRNEVFFQNGIQKNSKSMLIL